MRGVASVDGHVVCERRMNVSLVDPPRSVAE